jgi:hypothetical protein
MSHSAPYELAPPVAVSHGQSHSDNNNDNNNNISASTSGEAAYPAPIYPSQQDKPFQGDVSRTGSGYIGSANSERTVVQPSSESPSLDTPRSDSASTTSSDEHDAAGSSDNNQGPKKRSGKGDETPTGSADSELKTQLEVSAMDCIFSESAC